MRTKWHVCVLWSLLSLSCAADSRPSAFTRRKGGFFNQRPTASGSSLESRSSAGHHKAAVAHVSDVSVTCSDTDFVVRVKPRFYGLGAGAEELVLGSSCKSNGVLRPHGDLLFTYRLTDCGAVREARPGYLVYKFVLHYAAKPQPPPGRAHRMHVDIECRYQRNHHVYQLALKPTWQTVDMHKKLKGRGSDFKIELMDDSWSAPVRHHTYQINQPVNVQVSAPLLPPGGKLYIRSCYAAPSTISESSLKYSIIDNYGCMLDSKRDPGASAFISRTDSTLRWALKAFHFTADPDTEVSIFCELSVTSEDPGPAHKSCTYRGNGWTALAGDDSICDCCDSQCATSKSWEAAVEGSASSEFLLVSDQPYTPEESLLPIGPALVRMSRKDDITILGELKGSEKMWERSNAEEYADYDEGYAGEEVDEDEMKSWITSGEMREESVFRHGVSVEERRDAEEGSEESEVDSSAFDGEEDEGEEEEQGEGEVFDDLQGVDWRRGEAQHHWARAEELAIDPQTEARPPESEEDREEKRRNVAGAEKQDRTGGHDQDWKDDDGLADVNDMTWYFTWR